MKKITDLIIRSPQTLLLVDGSSFLYRAYHALPDLRSSSGIPTGALYGFINMLKRLRVAVPTAHAVCIFDAKGKTFRDDWYPQYKANRDKMPDDLVLQIAEIEFATRALGWPIVSVSGVEADDVIGTLAHQAFQRGWATVMATGDKDLTQLVNDRVLWFNTMSDEVLAPAGVTEKFGVPPERIVDYLTLVGDAVDNIPGVEKVGPKTAVKWLLEYGSLDCIVANADSIKGKVGENLRAALDWLPQARKLVTVKCDVDLSQEIPSLEAIEFKAENIGDLKALYIRSGFKTWLKTLEGSVEPQAEKKSKAFLPSASDELIHVAQELTPIKVRTNIVNTESALNALCQVLNGAEMVAFDCETTSLNPYQARLVGMSFAIEADSGWYIPVAHEGIQSVTQLSLVTVLTALKPWLESPCKFKIGQHLKYDTHVLANHGIAFRGVAHDTLLESYVLNSHAKHRLDSIGERYLHLSSTSYEDLCGKGVQQIGFAQVNIETAAHYAVEDVALCLGVHHVMYPYICADAGLRFIYESIELPTSQVLYEMERNGVLLDVNELKNQSHQIGQQLLALEKQAYELAGQPFNLNSPKQIGEIFFDKLGLPIIKKTSKGAASTDEDVLQKLAEDYPLPKTLLEYRGLSKLKSTYTDKLPLMVEALTGRVHTTYGQAIAVTGRLSSNEPNLQNIPIKSEQGRKIRTAFVAPKDSSIVSADYSQIELRILAHLSQDIGLITAFKNSEDIHRHTAAQVFSVQPNDVTFEQRRMAKVINFGLIYGMSAFGLANNLNISRTAAQSYMDAYFMRYPSVLNFMESTKQFAREHGYVTTHFGRRLYLDEINNRNMAKRQSAERAAINAPMQGTSADLIKLAMIAVSSELKRQKLQSKLIMQVHDELVLEVPNDELKIIKKLLPQCMANVAELTVPLVAEVGVGNNWDDAH